MRTFQEIKRNYQFTDNDEEILEKLAPIMEPLAPGLIDDFHARLRTISDAEDFLNDYLRKAESLKKLRQHHLEWLTSLFGGPYNEGYFRQLVRIGSRHLEISIVTVHLVYVGINFFRERIYEIIQAAAEKGELPAGVREDQAHEAVGKILDINLDIIARGYHDALIRDPETIVLSTPLDYRLVIGKRWVASVLNAALFGGLVLVGFLMLLQFLAYLWPSHGSSQNNFVSFFRENFEIMQLLGALLLLWLVIELIEEVTGRLLGRPMRIAAFAGLALVALIREILVKFGDLEKKSNQELIPYYLVGILILGAIYWLVSRVERKSL
jgi:uncharacterized membrane protein (DUF373 family)